MARAVAIFVGGVTELRQVAVRDDGVVFSRGQYRDPHYGPRWSKWTTTGETLGENARHGIDEMPAGFSTLRRAKPNDCCINNRALFDARGNIRVRLP